MMSKLVYNTHTLWFKARVSQAPYLQTPPPHAHTKKEKIIILKSRKWIP